LGDAAAQTPFDPPMQRSEVITKSPSKNAPQTVETRVAHARAQSSAKQVKAALAALHGDTSDPNKGNSFSSSSSSGFQATPMPASVALPNTNGFVDSQESAEPSIPRTPSMNLDVDNEPLLVKPPPEEYINRNLKPGDDGWRKQQSEKAIYTAEHELHHIDVRLQASRDMKYDHARGASNVLRAAEQGSHATAEMANAVHAQQKNDLAQTMQKIRDIKDEMVDVTGSDNKAHAKLQLRLERQKRKYAELLASAKVTNEAVEAAINKAGEIEGRARAQYHASMDPNMKLENAIIEAAKAKMALEEHDKNVHLENQREKSDEKKKEYFAKVDQQGQDAMAKIREQAEGAEAKAEEADYKAQIAQAKAVEAAAPTMGTVPMEQTVDPVEPAAGNQNAMQPQAVAAPVATQQSVKDDLKKSADMAAQAAAVTGSPATPAPAATPAPVPAATPAPAPKAAAAASTEANEEATSAEAAPAAAEANTETASAEP